MEMMEQNIESKVIASRRSSQEKKQVLEQGDHSNDSSVQSRHPIQENKKQTLLVEDKTKDDDKDSHRHTSAGSGPDSDPVPTNGKKLKANTQSTSNSKKTNLPEMSSRKEFAYENSKMKTATAEKSMSKLQQFLSIKKEQSSRNLDSDDVSRGAYSVVDKGKSKNRSRTSGSASVAPIDYQVRKLKSPSKSIRNLKSSGKSTRNLDSATENPSPMQSEDTSDAVYRVPGKIRQPKSTSKNPESHTENSALGGEVLDSPSQPSSIPNKPLKSDGRRVSKPTPEGDNRSDSEDKVNGSSVVLSNSKRNSTSKSESTLLSPEKQRKLLTTNSLAKSSNDDKTVGSAIDKLVSSSDDDVLPMVTSSKMSATDETLKTRHLRRLVDPTTDIRDEPLGKLRETSEKSNRMFAGTRRASLAIQNESDRSKETGDKKGSPNSKKSRRSSNLANNSPNKNFLPSKSHPRINEESTKTSKEEDSDAVREAAVAALEAAINAAKLAGLAVDVKVLPLTDSPDSPVNISPTIRKRGSNGSSSTKKMSRSVSASASETSNTSKVRRNTSASSSTSPASPSRGKVARSNSASATASIPKTHRRSSAGSSSKNRHTIPEDDIDDNESIRSETKTSKNKSNENVRKKRSGSKDQIDTDRDDIFTFFCWSNGQTNETEIRRNRQRMKDSMAGSPLNKAYARFSSITHYDQNESYFQK